MLYYLNLLLYYSTPIMTLVCFIVSLVLYLKTPKDSPERKPRRTFLIITSVATAVLVVLPIAFIALLASTVVFYM